MIIFIETTTSPINWKDVKKYDSGGETIRSWQVAEYADNLYLKIRFVTVNRTRDKLLMRYQFFRVDGYKKFTAGELIGGIYRGYLGWNISANCRAMEDCILDFYNERNLDMFVYSHLKSVRRPKKEDIEQSKSILTGEQLLLF